MPTSHRQSLLNRNIRQEYDQLALKILRRHGKCDKTCTKVKRHWQQPLDGYRLLHLTEKTVKVLIKISITQNIFLFSKNFYENKIE